MPSSSNTSQPWRIALVITELEVGGAERCLTHLALGLDRSRFEPAIYSLWPRPVEEQCELVRQLEAANVPVHFVGLRSARHLYQGSRKLCRLLTEFRPDLLQSFLYHANVLGTVSGRRARVPRIVQGMRVADRSAWRMMLERITSRFADRIVCVSDAVAAMARDEVRLPAEKLRVISNGIDVTRYSEASALALHELGVPAGQRAMSVVGRLHEQKGLDWLLTTMPRLLAEVSDVDLVVVGRGPDESSLRARAAELKIAERVHFVGWRADIPAILKSSALLVLPSRWEGMPNVLLEAMAAGLPVVATQAEGVSEVLGPLTASQVVTFGDDAALVAAIASVLRDRQRAAQLGQQNQARIAEQFSLTKMISRYEQLYGELLSVR